MTRIITALALVIATAAQPVLACGRGGSYRTHQAGVERAAKPAETVKSADRQMPTTGPDRSGLQTTAVNSAQAPTAASCSRYFAAVGAVLSVPCSS